MEQKGDGQQEMFECRQYLSNPAAAAGARDSEEQGQAPSFSLVSYNILANCHVVRADYKHVGEEFLAQGYRHRVLMKELQYLEGDLVCLQEVCPHYFTSTLLPAMKGMGYDGMMKCRTQDFYDEGSGTFYKTDVFELVDVKEVSLADSAHKMIDKMALNPEVKAAARDYLDRADIVLITRLRHKASGQVVTVGNTHLWWEEDLHPDVKTVQAACAVQEVVGVSGRDGAHVVCGDFNSDSASPVYQLMTDGCLSERSVQALQDVQCLQLDNGLSKSLIDHFKGAVVHESPNLKSSYCTVMGSEPEMTSYTGRKWTLDYTFYSADSLAVQGVLDFVHSDTLVTAGPLPSQHLPSDHMALKTCFTFA